MTVPNLDRMEPPDLLIFWGRHRNGYGWRELFPEGGKGTRAATADLANYAANRATELECSRNGSTAAQTYQTICTHIRERIPAWAMWHEEKAP